MPANAALIATAKVKHDLAYQAKRGIALKAVEGIEPEVAERIARLAKRIYARSSWTVTRESISG